MHLLAGMIILPAIGLEAGADLPGEGFPQASGTLGGCLPAAIFITGLLMVCGAIGLRYRNFLWLGYGCSVLPPSEMTSSPRRNRAVGVLGGAGLMLVLGTLGYWLASIASP